jgi:hypothetical protein
VSPSAGSSPTSAPPASSPTLSPTQAPPSFNPATYPQTWAGAWVDPDSGAGGSLDLTFTKGGPSAEGSLTIEGTACLTSGILDGAIDGGRVAFTVMQRGTTFEFVGTTDGRSMQGRFSADCDDLGGSWTAGRTN